MGCTLGSEEPPSAPEAPATTEESGLFGRLALPPVRAPDTHLLHSRLRGPSSPPPIADSLWAGLVPPASLLQGLSETSVDVGWWSWPGPCSRQAGSWASVAAHPGAGRGEARPSLRAPGPTGKCAPQLERKPDRARVSGSPGSPRMGTFLRLVLKCLRSHVELQTFPAGAAGGRFWARFHLCSPP